MSSKKPLAKTKPKGKPGPIAMPRMRCTFNVHPDVAEKIRLEARKRGVSMSAYVALVVSSAK